MKLFNLHQKKFETSIKYSFYILTAIAINLKIVESAFICPPSKEIIPCSCALDPASNTNGILVCRNVTTNQHDISNVFEKVEALNRLGNDNHNQSAVELINVSKFYLLNTRMEILDLLPLRKFQFNTIILTSSFTPSKMVNPVQNVTFKSKEMIIAYPNATSNFLIKLLDYVDPSTVTEMALGYLTEGTSKEDQLNLLLKLKSFHQLKTLRLSYNYFDTISSNIFENYLQIETFIFSYNNISQLSKNAFKIPHLDNEKENQILRSHSHNKQLRISLNFNELSDEALHPDCGLFSIRRPIKLELDFNNFQFLSQEKFSKFLNLNSKNTLSVKGNPLVCDERANWLVSGAEIFRKRVTGFICQGCHLTHQNCTLSHLTGQN